MTEEKKSIVEEVHVMESLLAQEGAVIEPPVLGDVITGSVIEIKNNVLYLDLGLLGGGIIIGRELQDGMDTADGLEPGDEVQGTVIEAETEEGYIELSLREAGYEKAWAEITRKMDEKETIDVTILEANKGGLIVKLHGVIGFLPVSQLTTGHYPRVENGDKNRILSILQSYVGDTFKTRIITADKEENKMIVSEKAVEAEEMQRRIENLSIGDEVAGIVSGVVDFGAFVKFNDDMEGLVHISELAWQRIDNPRDIIKVGQKVSCKIIGIDRDRISLSMKALAQDPWIQSSKKYKVGDTVRGEVTKMNPFGAFVQLDESIHGLAHVSEFPEKEGIENFIQSRKEYDFVVLSIEPKEHRLGLALKELHDKKKKDDDKKDDKEEKKDDKKKEKSEDKDKEEKKDDKKVEKKEKKEKKSEDKAEKKEKVEKKDDK